MRKFKAYLYKKYDFNSTLNKFDWVLIGIALGIIVSTFKSFILAFGIICLIIHLSYKRY